MVNNNLITSDTKVYCLLGNPVKNSLSPIIHNALFDYFDYDGVYLAFNSNNIELAITSIKNLGIMGCSVTMPYKLSIMKYLDCIDETAVKIGAVNTVVNKEGTLFGYNSDYYGAILAISEVSKIKNRTFVILGAGGTGRAIGYGIKKCGGILKIVNRTEKLGRELASILNADFCTITDIPKLKPDVIINTTSVGMSPKIDSMPIPEYIFNPSMVVMDIVYKPVETTFLRKAKQAGCKTINGLKMLIYQGAKQFEYWTGFLTPIGFIEKTILDHINIL